MTLSDVQRLAEIRCLLPLVVREFHRTALQTTLTALAQSGSECDYISLPIL